MLKKIFILISVTFLFFVATPLLNGTYAQTDDNCWTTEKECLENNKITNKCRKDDVKDQYCVNVLDVETGGTTTKNTGSIILDDITNCANGFSPVVSDDRSSCICKPTLANGGSCANNGGVGEGCNPGYVPAITGAGDCVCSESSNKGKCSVTTKKNIDISGNCGDGFITTAIGCIPVQSTGDFISWFLRWSIGISGGIAFLLIVTASFQIMTASGDPQKLQGGRELLTAAISGLILIIFSVFLLHLIGVTILQIPGL